MVDWHFLVFVLSSMGFSWKWCLWMFACRSSAIFFVLINGSSKGFFKSSRGIRQGDPLSPTLFIMVVESLSLLISKAADFNLIHSFRIGASSLQIHHLQFMDNSIIFCEANGEYVMNLRSILRWFQLAFSLRINYLKSEVYGINLDNNEYTSLSEFMGCVSSILPSTYLGLPLCIGFPDYSLSEPIIHKFRKRLASWKGNYLWMDHLPKVCPLCHACLLFVSFQMPPKSHSVDRKDHEELPLR